MSFIKALYCTSDTCQQRNWQMSMEDYAHMTARGHMPIICPTCWERFNPGEVCHYQAAATPKPTNLAQDWTRDYRWASEGDDLDMYPF